jgi:hypothetical protein
MMKKTKSVIIFLGKFILYLSGLYILWLPLARYYLIVRLKLSYILLNITGYYPKFDTSEVKVSQGEMFSFIPFLALMLATYGKNIYKKWRPILIIGLILFGVEVLGRFFEKLYIFNPQSFIVAQMSVFLLATVRVAIPFLGWLFISLDDLKSNS